MEDLFVDVALTCCFKQLTASCEQGGGDKSRPSCVFLDVLLHCSWEHEETKTKIFPGFTRKEYSSMIFKWDNFVTPCKVSVKIMDKRFWLTASDYVYRRTCEKKAWYMVNLDENGHVSLENTNPQACGKIILLWRKNRVKHSSKRQLLLYFWLILFYNYW